MYSGKSLQSDPITARIYHPGSLSNGSTCHSRIQSFSQFDIEVSSIQFRLKCFCYVIEQAFGIGWRYLKHNYMSIYLNQIYVMSRTMNPLSLQNIHFFQQYNNKYCSWSEYDIGIEWTHFYIFEKYIWSHFFAYLHIKSTVTVDFICKYAKKWGGCISLHKLESSL